MNVGILPRHFTVSQPRRRRPKFSSPWTSWVLHMVHKTYKFVVMFSLCITAMALLISDECWVILYRDLVLVFRYDGSLKCIQEWLLEWGNLDSYESLSSLSNFHLNSAVGNHESVTLTDHVTGFLLIFLCLFS